MNPTEPDIEKLRNLEHAADELLAEIAASAKPASHQSVQRLDSIAAEAAQIAFGTGHPELLTGQMSTLITWTNHLDDSSWSLRFQNALMTRPLVSPWK